ncbi:MAG: 23S rRNA (adenine(2503)-C(2))-methyltransferase RlmN [Candidatus Zipacnadales bacterium]
MYEFTRAEIGQRILASGYQRFRADQIFHWAHARLAGSFEQMTNLPATLRETLATQYSLGPLDVQAISEADDSTKLLIRLTDGEFVECVRMVTGPAAASLCLSSQVGCAIRCVFCASGAHGLVRNLRTSEIVGQAITLRALVGPARNVVFMGMGEPLHNLTAVLRALTILVDKCGWGISSQRITVATSGVAASIRQYAREGLPTELAVSLNAPHDELRRKLMPGARDSMEELLAACDEFVIRHHGQPVTFTYVLLAGVNDQPEHARALTGLLRDRRHHLNLIPYNRIVGAPFRSPSVREVKAFARRLGDAGLNVSIRRSHGQSIQAACGQLRANQLA